MIPRFGCDVAGRNSESASVGELESKRLLYGCKITFRMHSYSRKEKARIGYRPVTGRTFRKFSWSHQTLSEKTSSRDWASKMRRLHSSKEDRSAWEIWGHLTYFTYGEIWGHLTYFTYGDKFNWYGVPGFPGLIGMVSPDFRVSGFPRISRVIPIKDLSRIPYL